MSLVSLLAKTEYNYVTYKDDLIDLCEQEEIDPLAIEAIKNTSMWRWVQHEIITVLSPFYPPPDL